MTAKRATNLSSIKRAGPYSQVMEAGGMVFLSGIIPLKPDTTEMVTDSVQASTHRVMQNMQLILKEVGLTMDEVAKVTIFLTDMADYPTVNEVYGEYFDDDADPPARSAVAVAGLPKGVSIEVEAIAVRNA